MKKIIIILILLILAAGTAGYFGWVKIDPGTFGIAHSSITGTIPYPLESGKLYWFWQKLIPKSFYVYTVSNKPDTFETEIKQPLPGSGILSQYGNFNIRIYTGVQYRIDFESAAKLLNNGLLEDFNDFFSSAMRERLNDVVSSFIVENLARPSRYSGTADYGVLDSLKKRIEATIREETARYKLKEVSFSVTFPEVPQIAVYNEALNRYFDYMDRLSQLEQEKLAKNMEYQSKISENDAEIDRWKKYGELLEQYPELLKYFYIQKFSEQADVLILPQDESSGFPKMLDVLPYIEPEKSVQQFPQKSEAAPESEKGLPEQTETAPSQSQEQNTTAEETHLVETPAETTGKTPPVEKKWYDSLMFWKHLKK